MSKSSIKKNLEKSRKFDFNRTFQLNNGPNNINFRLSRRKDLVTRKINISNYNIDKPYDIKYESNYRNSSMNCTFCPT